MRYILSRELAFLFAGRCGLVVGGVYCLSTRTAAVCSFSTHTAVAAAFLVSAFYSSFLRTLLSRFSSLHILALRPSLLFHFPPAYRRSYADPPASAKAIWDFEGIFCSSRHIPGVRFAGLIHPGIMGCAPSAEVLDTWNKRESELISTHTHLHRTVAEPPNAQNVHAGSATGELKEKIGKEGARTIPGRPENGGNVDVNGLSRGSKVYLPVHVKGAKFSVGDLHFSQGDGCVKHDFPKEKPSDLSTAKFPSAEQLKWPA